MIRNIFAVVFPLIFLRNILHSGAAAGIFYAMLVVLIAGTIYLNQDLFKGQSKLQVPLLLFAAYLLFNLILFEGIQALFASIGFFITLIIWLMNVYEPKSHIHYPKLVFFWTVFLIAFDLLLIGGANKNLLSQLFFLNGLLLFMHKPKWPVFLLILASLIVLGGRSSLLAALVFFGLAIIEYLPIRRFVIQINLLAFIVISFLVVFLNLLESGHFSGFQSSALGSLAFMIEEYSFEIFGRSFFTGRDEIWPLAVENILDKPILGYGLGFSLKKTSYLTLSTHNLYLSIWLQIGLVGLVILLGLFRRMMIEAKYVKFLPAYVAAFMIQQSFEVSFFHNNLGIGILFLMNYYHVYHEGRANRPI